MLCQSCGADKLIHAPACRYGIRIQRSIAKLEALVGEPLGEWLRRRYVDELATYRELRTELHLQPRQLIDMMRRFGIAPRERSEAVRLQWVGNDVRRSQTRALAHEHLVPAPSWTSDPEKRVLIGAKISASKRQSNAIKRPEVLNRQRASFAKTLRRNPRPVESALMAELDRRGIGYAFQVPIKRYVMDFAFHATRLCVETDNTKHAGREKRAAWDRRDVALAELGWRTLRLSNREVFANVAAACDKIEAHLQQPSRDPSALCQDGVLISHAD